MKSHLSVVVLLIVASMGSTAFAQDGKYSRSMEERIKDSMTSRHGREGIATAASIGAATSLWMMFRVRSPHLERLDAKITGLEEALAVKAPLVAEKERLLQEALAASPTEDLAHNHKIFEEINARYKMLKPDALREVETSPGDVRDYVAMQQEEAERTVSNHGLAMSQGEANIEYARRELAAAKATTPEMAVQIAELEDLQFSRAGRLRQAVFATLGERAVWLGSFAALAFVVKHEIVVLRENDVSPSAARPEETNQFLAALALRHR